MKWPFVSRARYERELWQASNLAKTLGSMVNREYGRAMYDGKKLVHEWASDAAYKVHQLGDNPQRQFQNAVRVFNPDPLTVSEVLGELPKVGGDTRDTHPSPWVEQLAAEVAQEGRQVRGDPGPNPGDDTTSPPLTFGEPAIKRSDFN